MWAAFSDPPAGGVRFSGETGVDTKPELARRPQYERVRRAAERAFTQWAARFHSASQAPGGHDAAELNLNIA